MNTISSEGRIKIRATDDSDSIQITDKLKTLGLEVIPHQEKNNKAKYSLLFLIEFIFKYKSNFLYVNNLDWKEGNLQIEEKRLHVKSFLTENLFIFLKKE